MPHNATIGDRIRNRRELLGITQDQLAERAGVSVDTIRKLEQNVRRTSRIDTLRHIATALDVELERLLGQPTVTQTVPADGGLLALRDALQDVDALPGVPTLGTDTDPPAADAWMADVTAATATYWHGDYSDLAGTLPRLLRDGRAVARDTQSGSLVEEVWRQLALAYQLAASLATQAGHLDWAYLAVAKELEAAQRASDPLIEGMGVSTLSWVLLRQGRWEQAQDITERKADQLEPSLRRSTPEQYAVYGNLLLAAAIPAARRGLTTDANEYLAFASAAADRSGALHAYGTAFGPVDVATQAVNAALAGPAPDPARALRLAAAVDHAAVSRPVHLASHRLDVAQAQYQSGDHDGALGTLLDVEQKQPEWIQFQTLAKATVGELWEAQRRKTDELRGLATRLGVDPNI